MLVMTRIPILRNWRIVAVVTALTVASICWSADTKAARTSINETTDLVFDGLDHLYVIESETEKVLRINLVTAPSLT